MQVSDPNNVKIYNLSAGKSLPDWLSERKKRALQKKNVDIRRRIELIQDFEMPGVSTTVKLSKDGSYILATGIYKPRVRCYDVNNLAMKFERCFDSEVVTFIILSDDYSKPVFLHCDRYVEFHAAPGRYYRLRIPKFGRDMQYHEPSCDLFLVGASSEIYRLNLERGQFLNSFVSEATEINKCCINPVHHMLVCGTAEGKVEAWDPRSRSRVGVLDVALTCLADSELDGFPSVTALNFDGALTLGVGCATGQVLLFDIRSNKPFCVKDHMYGLPIKDVEFHPMQDLVLSMDSNIVKIWEKNSGKLFTSIEAVTEFNNLCLVPNTGLMFIANENVKIQTYYIPSMGPAPKWCGFLDSLTEELEESNVQNVYDDYKFVTKKELEDLGLDHLLGTNLLRAYMHGYFVDIRLYKRAKQVADPFAFDEYKKKKIREKIEEGRANRVKINKLPSVNKDLALKLMDEEQSASKKKKPATNLLKDDRFKALFNAPEFEIDKNDEQYRLLNPVLSRLDKSRKKELKKQIQQQFEEVEEEEKGQSSIEESSVDDSSSDDDQEWKNEVKRQYKQIRNERRRKDEEEDIEDIQNLEKRSEPRLYELKEGFDFKGLSGNTLVKEVKNIALADRLAGENQSSAPTTLGSQEMSFKVNSCKWKVKAEREARKHREERKRVIRSTKGIGSKRKFWKGK